MTEPEDKTTSLINTVVLVADAASWYCALVLLALLLTRHGIDSVVDCSGGESGSFSPSNIRRPCDEIYVVGEAETLQTISEKCGDPFIVERNPHIHDPDDVFPGLVLMIVTPPLRSQSP